MPLKVYATFPQHFFLYTVQICADAAGVAVEVVIPSAEQAEDKDWKAKKGHRNFPILELEDGTWICEHIAICKYLLALGGKNAMLGENAFDAAKIDQWGSYIATKLQGIWKDLVYCAFGLPTHNPASWEPMIASLSAELPIIEAGVSGDFLVGNDLTVADILLWRIAFALFAFLLGPEQRAAVPKFTAWYEKMMVHPLIVATAGKYHMTAEPWKLFDCNKTVTVGAAAPAAAKEEAGDDDECDDLFGSDDEDEEAFATRMELKAKAHAEKSGKVKKEVIAKSMILFEVKPLDDQTDLDALAARIQKDIVKDGLQWKEQYKKDPVAFGIFKLIIGCTIEDLKVSCDDLQEDIEAFEDMVQSVDIAAFNKV